MSESETIRVLLIEDDDHDALAFERGLRRDRESVFHVRRLEKAESLLEDVQAMIEDRDVVVFDNKLPGVQGIEAGKRLLEVVPDMPMALLTAEGSEELVVRALRAGFADYMSKDPRGGYLIVLPSKLRAAVRRARLRLALRESRERYARLVETSAAIYYSFSRSKGDGYLSRRVEDVLGYSRQYLLEHPFHWNESIHPKDKPLVEQAIAAMEAGGHYTAEYRIKTADGRWIWLRDSSLSVTLRDGERVVEGMALDITSEKRLEELRKDFKRMNYHDMRSPLAGIIGMSEMLAGDLEGEAARTVNLIAASGRRVLDILDRTLDMHRLEEGLYAAAIETVDLDDLVRSVLGGLMARESFRDRKVEVAAGGAVALADPSLCGSALANLLTNALEAEGSGGQIRVSSGRDGEAAWIVIWNATPVPREVRDGFFEKYKTWGKKRGMGLGAYSAKLMAEAMGGVLTMRASEEEGTLLRLALRRAPQ